MALGWSPRATRAQSGDGVIYSPTFDGCALSVSGGQTTVEQCGGNGNKYNLTLTSTSSDVSCNLVPVIGAGSNGLFTGLSLTATV